MITDDHRQSWTSHASDSFPNDTELEEWEAACHIKGLNGLFHVFAADYLFYIFEFFGNDLFIDCQFLCHH